MTWAAIGAAGIGAAGTMGQAAGAAATGREAANVSKMSLKEQQRQFNARRAAFEQMQRNAQGFQETGEKQFLGETGQPLPELEAAKQAIQSGSAEGMQEAGAQTRAGLTQMGVRGGQAGQLLARQQGAMGQGMQRQIDEMALQEADKRRQLRSTLFGQKSLAGQSGILAQPGF